MVDACIPSSASCRANSRSRCRRTANDRAALKFHDIGIEIVKNDAGETGYRVFVGGGMGRTPYVGCVVGEFVAKPDILAFLEAVMRVYNEQGRRDNILQGAHENPGASLGRR